MASTLDNRHIADLHALAAAAGVEGYRLLPRDELVAAILERDPDAAESSPAGASEGARSASVERAERGDTRREPSGGRGGRGGRSRRNERRDDEGAEEEEPDAGEPVSGVLDITPRGHGFIRLDGLESGDDDVYVSPSQIRRCEMQRGDEVAGPARKPRRGERYPALIHVDRLNGAEPGAETPRLEDATPVHPSRRIDLIPADDASTDEAILLGAIDLLTPLAFGQRVLVRAAAGSGRTTLLRALARALASREDLELVVLLIDERPEEVEAWRKAAPGAELAVATGEMRSGEQLRLVELALGRATRRAESGADVVLLIDSLSRIAVAADDPGRVKPIFGAGRETEEEGVGSLTIVATTLDGGEDEGAVGSALETTENSLIALDRELAAAGTFPAIDPNGSRLAAEEQLRDEDELAAVRSLRADLAGRPVAEAAAELRSRVEEAQAGASTAGTE